MRNRRMIGTLRLAAGAFLFVTIAIQIGDRVANNAFDPWEYFSYFTIESSLINIVVFLVGGVMALRLARDTELFTIIRMSALTYAVITAVVYNVLLRNVPYAGSYEGIQWPNEVIHVWIPVVIVLDWLLSPGRPALHWSALRIVVIFPLAWLFYTLMRGAASSGQIYPYPFLDPATAGWGSVIGYIVGLTAFLVGIGALAVEYGRVRSRHAVSHAHALT